MSRQVLMLSRLESLRAAVTLGGFQLYFEELPTKVTTRVYKSQI